MAAHRVLDNSSLRLLPEIGVAGRVLKGFRVWGVSGFRGFMGLGFWV